MTKMMTVITIVAVVLLTYHDHYLLSMQNQIVRVEPVCFLDWLDLITWYQVDPEV